MAWPTTGTDNDAVFGGTAGTATLSGTLTANDLTFTTTGYTLTGGTLTLNGTTPTINNGTGINATIASIIAGSAGLTKTGDGILTLSGTNTYTAGTTITSGTVIAQNSAAFGANGSSVTVSSGAAIDLGGTLAANGLNQGTRVFTVSGSGVGGTGVLTSTATNVQINAISKIALAGNATFGGSQRWDVRSNTPTIDMAGFTLTKTGANYIAIVAAAVTPGAGTIVIDQGELSLTTSTSLSGSAANAITVNSGGTLSMYQSSSAHAWTLNLNEGSILRGENGTTTQNTWTGPVTLGGNATLQADGVLNVAGAVSGSAGLTKTGGATAVLSGNNSSWSGSLTISTGTLQVNSAASLGTGSTITTLAAGNGALVLGDGVTAGSGKSISIAGGGAGGFFGALSTTGTATWQGNVVIDAATGTRVGTLGTSGSLTISGNITEPAGVPSELIIRTNAAAVPVILTGNNSYTGGTRLLIGSLRLGSADALGTGAGNLTISGSTTLSSDGATARSIANNVALEGNSTFGDATNNGTLTFTGPTSLGGATRTLTIASTTEFANTISATGTFGITKAGSGDLVLSGANTYAGDTTLTAGRIIVGNANALGATSGKTRIDAGTLEFATDTSVAPEVFDMGSGNTGTIVINRATAGAGITQTLGNATLGNATLNVERGSNVTSGVATLEMGTIGLSAGSAGTLNFNPTTARLLITGGISSISNNAKTIALGGSHANNLISGTIANGTNVVAVLKNGTSTWELSGENSYTGATTVSQGTLTLSGARTNVAIGTITVGNTAGQDATLNISNGSHNLGTGQMSVGNAPTTPITATVNQTGGVVSFAAGGGNQLLIGQNSVANRGIYNLSGGSLTIGLSTANGRGVMLGVNTGSSGGTFNLSGTGQLNMTAASGGTGNATLQVGRFDSAANDTTNHFNQTGGTASIGVLSIGGNGATGTGITSSVSLTGGTFSAASFPRMSAGDTNVATITIGGTADVTLPAFPTARGTGSTATLLFDGGTLRPAAESTTYLGGLTNAYVNGGGARFDTGAFNITVSQPLLAGSGSGGLTKEGLGGLTLSGANTFTGATAISAGTLLLNGSLASASAVSVSPGATLGGSGTIGGPTTILGGGILSPGNSPGTLTIDNTLALADTSILAFEINPTDQAIGGGINDLVTGVTNLTLGGTLNLSGSGDFTTVTQGTTWRLINYTGTLTLGTLTIGTAPTLADGSSFNVDTTTGGQVNLVVVPEPGSLLLVALGVAAAGWLRLRQES